MSRTKPFAILATTGLTAMLLAVSAVATDSARPVPHTVFELRQYTLHPGQRDVLIDLFDDHFVEGQEQQGMRVIGQFRNRDNPDRFVWLRSFADMPARAVALNAFYTGPIWKAHNGAANATMVDSNNVLLLRPLRPDTAFAISTQELPPPGTRGPGKGAVLVSIVYLTRSAAEFGEFFETRLKPHWERAGATVVAELVSEHSPNTFPALPVRESENVFVWVSLLRDEAAAHKQRSALAGSADWRALSGELSLWTHQPIETLRLEPTARSRLQWSASPTRVTASH